jgi:hypothetical protein
VVVAFADGGAGGVLTPAKATTDSSGTAITSYTAGTKAGTVQITPSVAGLTSVVFKGDRAGGTSGLSCHLFG